MTEADEFRKSAEFNRRRRLSQRIHRAWNEGFAFGFVLAVIACAIIVLALRAL